MLDVGEASPLHSLLLHPGTRELRTVYEEDFGHSLGDLLLLRPPRRRRSAAAELAAWHSTLLRDARNGGREQHPARCSEAQQHHGLYVTL